MCSSISKCYCSERSDEGLRFMASNHFVAVNLFWLERFSHKMYFQRGKPKTQRRLRCRSFHSALHYCISVSHFKTATRFNWFKFITCLSLQCYSESKLFELLDLFFLRCRQLFLTSSYFEPCKGPQVLLLFALSEGSSALQGQSERPAADKRKRNCDD